MNHGHDVALLDPWSDTALIALRLQNPDAQLLVAIGAEQWCSKCRRLRLLFKVVLRLHVPGNVVTLWLDLEDHAEFMGTFLPDDLPLLLLWRDGRCERASQLVDVQLPEAHVSLRHMEVPVGVPNFWLAFSKPKS